MKIRQRLPAVVLLFVAGCMTNGKLNGSFKKPAPMETHQLIGTWISSNPNSLYFYRLVLEAEGTGQLGILSWEDRMYVYAIDRWDYAKPHITFSCHALTPTGLGTLQLSASSKGQRKLLLTVFGGKWREETVLFREQDVEVRIQRAKISMSEPSAESGDGKGVKKGVSPMK